MPQVAVATSSTLAAEAAAEVSALGGNAVDCALAAAILTTNTEPGVCALAGSAFVTVWAPGQDPITIDGNVAAPGSGEPAYQPGDDVTTVSMEYGGGVETLVGAASVAIPGSLAAFDKASRAYGRTKWADVLAPSIRAAKDGFPLSSACHYYLQYSGTPIFGRSDDGYRALHDGDALRPLGSSVRVPHLAYTLEAIAEEGSELFYKGDLGRAIAEHVQAGGGLLTREDLQNYEARIRSCLTANIGEWTLATNPPPAVGGTILCAMLMQFLGTDFETWTPDALAHLVAVQEATLQYRQKHLDLSDDIKADIATLLDSAKTGNLISRYASGSTVHTSAVDSDGLACAITASSGYGSGEMPAGTGLWLNNCLGEIELNQRGLDAGPPGSRLPSNMAPTVARSGDKVLAAGSPGADRITTALQQFFLSMMQMNMPLPEAIEQPRVHVEVRGDDPVVAHEPGLDLPDLPIACKPYPQKGMYFGGVGATLFDRQSGFELAADSRREGGTFVSS